MLVAGWAQDQAERARAVGLVGPRVLLLEIVVAALRLFLGGD